MDAIDTDPFAVRPPDHLARRFRTEGVWRDDTVITDLHRWRDETPHATALVAQRSGDEPEFLSWREYADRVDRIAAGLAGLGVGPRDVVAVQLPNWWELDAVLLACFELGAVAAPLVPGLGSRELERVLRSTRSAVLVTAGPWRGADLSAAAADVAPQLPGLRHRVVVGGSARPGEVDFADLLRSDPLPAGAVASDPDAVSLVLFTSGTTGEPKGAVHTLNAMHGGVTGMNAGARTRTGRQVWFTPHAHSHIMGILAGLLGPLLTGGCGVLLDAWDPATVLPMLRDTGVTDLLAAPVYLESLIAEVRRSGEKVHSLAEVMTGGAPVRQSVVDAVADALGLPLRVLWGMTEAGMTMTTAEDPDDWGAHSVGRPIPGLEVELRGEPPFDDSRPGELFVRGASVALATVGRDTGRLRVTAEEDDGWYDTGDLAAPDGRGGIRLLGRAVDRIGRTFMVPVADVEDALRGHPRVADVALVGVVDATDEERSHAVVVPAGKPPTLAELNGYLRGLGMTEWYLPDEVSIVATLPRNVTGKVQKVLLREQLLSARS